MSGIPVDKFAWWIFGYQNFSEEIIKKCICHAKGWEAIRVYTGDPQKIKSHTEKRPDWQSADLELLRKRAWDLLDKRRKAMALDAAFHDGDQFVIGEFKSWGGFENPHDPAKLREAVRNGEWFPDRLAIHSVVYEKEKHPVSRFVIATGLQGATSFQFPVGDLTVEVFDIPNLLRDNVKALQSEKEKWFNALKEAVERVKTYVETGCMPDAVHGCGRGYAPPSGPAGN